MIFTGNFLIDYVNPLYKGNFSIFDGNVNLGQRNTLINTAVNFLENSIDSKQNNLVVYVTYSKKSAILLKEKLNKKLEDLLIKKSENLKDNENELDLPAEIQNKTEVTEELLNDERSKFIIFSLGENPTNCENYYLPKIAFNYTEKIIKEKNLIFKNENKLNVLFCIDDLSGFALTEREFYEATKLFQVRKKKNLLNILIVFKSFLE